MGGDSLLDGFVGDLFFGNLPDVEGFVIGTLEILADLGDHVLHGDLFARCAAATPAFVRLGLCLTCGHVDGALVCDSCFLHHGGADLLHEVRDGTGFYELRA